MMPVTFVRLLSIRFLPFSIRGFFLTSGAEVHYLLEGIPVCRVERDGEFKSGGGEGREGDFFQPRKSPDHTVNGYNPGPPQGPLESNDEPFTL